MEKQTDFARGKCGKTIVAGFLNPVYPEGHSRKQVYLRIWNIFAPATAEYALLQLVNMFDQMQVGSLGAEALVAVGLAGQVRSILITLFLALNIGLTAMVARALGQKREDGISVLVSNGFLITLILSIVISYIGTIIAKPMLILFNIPDEVTLEYGVQYLRIILMGFIPLALTTTLTAALRGIGNTKVSLFYNALSNILNIFFNWVLINGNLGFPRLEVKGAAIATVIGQAVAFFIALGVAFRRGNCLGMKVQRIIKSFDWPAIKDIFRIGLPAMLSQGMSRFGIATYNAIVASLGTSLYATHVICTNIQLLTGMTGQSCEIVSMTMSGQSLGAERKDLAVLYTNCSLKLCLLLSVVLMAVYSLFGGPIIGLYNSDSDIIINGITPLRIIALMQLLSAIQYVASGAIKGAGDTLGVSIYSLTTKCILRPILAFIAVYKLNLGLNGAWWAHCLSECVCSILIGIRYLSGKWMYAFKQKRR